MNVDELRIAAASQSLFGPTSLAAALRTFGFVQADPIRAPARAQDLILRHRVKAYRAGDLERLYPQLDIEEAVLYAYGFVSGETYALLHPESAPELAPAEERVLAIVRDHGPLHPGDMHRWFGRDRVLNPWGGRSLETTSTLEHLRRRGYVRVARRDAGVRVYEAMTARPASEISPSDRARALIGTVAEILGPVPEATLSGIAARLVRALASSVGHRALMREMLASGEYVREEIAGLTYWRSPRKRTKREDDAVRFLAPFDPIVWDRRRFEHVWRWEYRFEAYVPPAKRVRGYYALPLLWRSDVIGWANARIADGKLGVELGYAKKKPRERAFANAVADEIDRLRAFLTPR